MEQRSRRRRRSAGGRAAHPATASLRSRSRSRVSADRPASDGHCGAMLVALTPNPQQRATSRRGASERGSVASCRSVEVSGRRVEQLGPPGGPRARRRDARITAAPDWPFVWLPIVGRDLHVSVAGGRTALRSARLPSRCVHRQAALPCGVPDGCDRAQAARHLG